MADEPQDKSTFHAADEMVKEVKKKMNSSNNESKPDPAEEEKRHKENQAQGML